MNQISQTINTKNTELKSIDSKSLETKSQPSDIQEAVNVLGKSFVDYKNSSENEIRNLKTSLNEKLNDLTLTKKSNTAPSTWNVSEDYKGLSDYVCKGSLGYEQKSNDVYGDYRSESGGYACLTNLNKTILQNPDYYSPIRDLATVQTVKAGTNYEILSMKNQFEIMDNDVFKPYDVSQDFSQPDLLKETINFHALEVCLKITPDLMEQNRPINFEKFLQSKISQDISLRERKLFATGLDGKIESFIPKNLGNAIDLKNYDPLLDAISSLDDIYHNDAVWLMTRKTYMKLLGIKDGQNRYIMKSHESALHPYFMGYPIYFVPEIDCIDEVIFDDSEAAKETKPETTGSKDHTIVFGNLKLGYMIVEHSELFAMHDPYSSKPIIQNYVRKYIGTKVVRQDAFVGLKVKA